MNNIKNGYKTVKEQVQISFTERKSEFIGTIHPVSREEEAVGFINEIKSKNKKAAHNCYAYILRENNIARYSDDGEPSGTAGIPIYEVLKKEGLTDTAVVVTRYFGGILLGAGGLVRAYSGAAAKAVSAAVIKNMNAAEKYELCLDYSFYGRLGAVFSAFDVRTAEETFAENVKIQIFIKESVSEKFRLELTDVLNGKIIIKKLQNEMYDFG